MNQRTIENQLNKVLEGAERQLLPVHGTPLRIYVQKVDGLPSILLRVTSACSLPDFIHGTQGIHVSLDKNNSSLYQQIALRSKTKSMNGAFYALACDLFEVAAQNSEEQSAVDSMLLRFDEFRNLMQLERNGLSEDEVRGLIAELKTLQLLVNDYRMSPAQALLSWHGPYGGNKDVVCGGSALEVKSLRQNATSIKISNIEQLTPNDLMLYLATVYLEKIVDSTQAGTFSLREVIAEFHSLIENDINLVKQFEAALHSLGYEESDPDYPDWRYRLCNQKFYQVTETFPRIRATDIPQGVKSVQYSLMIETLDQFKIDFEKVKIGN